MSPQDAKGVAMSLSALHVGCAALHGTQWSAGLSCAADMQAQRGSRPALGLRGVGPTLDRCVVGQSPREPRERDTLVVRAGKRRDGTWKRGRR